MWRKRKYKLHILFLKNTEGTRMLDREENFVNEEKPSKLPKFLPDSQ